MAYLYGLIFFILAGAVLSGLKRRGDDGVVILGIIGLSVLAGYFFSVVFAGFCFGVWLMGMIGITNDALNSSNFQHQYGGILSLVGLASVFISGAVFVYQVFF